MKETEEVPETNQSTHPRPCCCLGCISWFWTKFKVRGHLITAATLTATMAYQSILSPPGGLWQDSKRRGLNAAAPPVQSLRSDDTLDADHTAGEAIMGSNTTDSSYRTYLLLNTIVLGASLSTIMLAMTGFPMENKFLTWLMVFTVYITISCMGGAYVIAINLVSPDQLSEDVLNVLFLGWAGLCVFVMVLHSCRFLVWLVRKLVKLVKACCGCCKACYGCGKPTPRATKNSVTKTIP